MNKYALGRLAQRIGALETRRGNGGRSYMMTSAGPWWNAEAIAAQAEQYRALSIALWLVKRGKPGGWAQRSAPGFFIHARDAKS